MSSIIYETINLYNKENNILPYKYLGSDQHNKPEYLGSSKLLLKDVKKLGKQFFEKKVLCEFKDDIPNTLLRKIESQIQKFMDVANDPEYYNKTNSSHIGYVETDEQKKIRMHKTKNAREIWWNSLSEESKKLEIEKSKKNIIDFNKTTKGKTYDEIYGPEKALLKKQKHSGKNNGMSKRIMDINSGKIFHTMYEAMNYYGIKKYETLKKRCVKEIEMKFI